MTVDMTEYVEQGIGKSFVVHATTDYAEDGGLALEHYTENRVCAERGCGRPVTNHATWCKEHANQASKKQRRVRAAARAKLQVERLLLLLNVGEDVSEEIAIKAPGGYKLTEKAKDMADFHDCVFRRRKKRRERENAHARS